jgi:hypothetical protein
MEIKNLGKTLLVVGVVVIGAFILLARPSKA